MTSNICASLTIKQMNSCAKLPQGTTSSPQGPVRGRLVLTPNKNIFLELPGMEQAVPLP